MPTQADYKIFHQNEMKMADLYKVRHLAYLKRPEYKIKNNTDKVLFRLLPSYGTLSSLIEGAKNYKKPTQKTIEDITEFFKAAYYLPYPEKINSQTLLEESIETILHNQGLTKLQRRECFDPQQEGRKVGTDWLTGKYFCYYSFYNSAIKKHEVKGCVLNILESKNYSYKAVMISGFSGKNQLDAAMWEIFSSEMTDESFFRENYRTYKEKQKYDLDKTLYYWKGDVVYEKDFVKGSFLRDNFCKKQELTFYLFSVKQSEYKNCAGAVGTQIASPNGNNEMIMTKFLVSRISLEWENVKEFFDDRKEYTYIGKSDDGTFLKLIQIAEMKEVK